MSITAGIAARLYNNKLIFLGLLIFLWPYSAKCQSALLNLPKAECSYGRTNSDCYILVDRNDPITPVTMQLYTGARVTVILLNPRIYEQYTLDPVYPPTQTAVSADVGSTLLGGVFSAIQKFGGLESGPAVTWKFVPGGPQPEKAECPSDLKIDKSQHGDACFNYLQQSALHIYKRLLHCELPDAIYPGAPGSAADACSSLIENYDQSSKDERSLEDQIQSFIDGESALSGAIAKYSKATSPAPDPTLSAELTMKITDYDSLAQDLNGYRKRLKSLNSPERSFPPVCARHSGLSDAIKIRVGCKRVTQPDDTFLVLRATKDNVLYGASVSRPVTFQLNTFNLVTNPQAASIDPTKKKNLATVNLNFADSHRWFGVNTFRWEGSAGVFFSAIPDRSYSITALYYQKDASATDPDNCPAASSTNPIGTLCDNVVTQKILRPSLVPFTALHYRLSPDATFIPWKTALYLTGAVGYNVNTNSADFAGGLSLNWRSIMISPLWHWGHDVRPIDGFYWKESLGAGFKGTTVPTENYWRDAFAVGISVRVPSLTGR